MEQIDCQKEEKGWMGSMGSMSCIKKKKCNLKLETEILFAELQLKTTEGMRKRSLFCNHYFATILIFSLG